MGDVSVVSILYSIGKADINARVGKNTDGGSPLWLAKAIHPSYHEVIRLLVDAGAVHIDPGQARKDEL
jgi:hypothetical protein